MKCSFGIFNFLEEISSLSHFVVFLYLFALIAEEGFLISPCYSLELCIQVGISFLFSFSLHCLKNDRIISIHFHGKPFNITVIQVYAPTSNAEEAEFECLYDGQHRNQIDYILCSQRWRSSIQSAKTRPGADCGSDYERLVAKFRLKLKKVGKTIRPFRYDLN